MFRQLSNPLKALVFYALSIALALLVARTPGASSFTYMFTPLVAVLITMLVVTREGYERAGWARLGLHRPGLATWRTALLVPIAAVGIAFLLLWTSDLATFAVPDRIEGYRTEGWFWLAFPFVLMVTLVLNTLTNSLGEELGWRGFLLPHLAQFGPVRAMALTGFLHALWHLPFMLMTSLYHAEGDRLVVVPLFFVSVTLAGFLFGYLRLASGSVWPAALGHTAHNLVWAVLALFTTSTSPLAVEYLAGDTGLLVALGYAGAAAWVVWRVRSWERRPSMDSHLPTSSVASPGGTG